MTLSPTPRRPDPEPLETNDVAIVTVGTVLWAIALVASLIFRGRLADSGNEGWVWIFLAGTFLGLIGIRYVRKRRAELRRKVSKVD
jgi:MFS family permease